MSSLPTSTIIAATAGLFGSVWASGGQAMLSLLAIPGLLSTTTPVPTQLLAQQWAGIYNRGKVLGPQTAVLALVGYGYLAYERSSSSSSSSSSSGSLGGRPGGGWAKFVGAAALTLGIVPFTVVFMDATNQALLRVAEGTGAVSEGALRELLVRWKGLNLVRSLFPLAGAAVGFWGLVA